MGISYHIMVDDKFIDDFISEITSLSSIKHLFYIVSSNNVRIYSKSEKVELVTIDDLIKIVKQIKNQDKLFIHYYYLTLGKILTKYLAQDVELNVVHWGGDFYCEPMLHHKNWLLDPITLKWFNKTYVLPKKWAKRPNYLYKQLIFIYKLYKKAKIDFLEKQKSVSRINNILLHKSNFGEIELTERLYNLPKNKFIHKPFWYNLNADLALKIANSKIENINKKQINIQIGNSGAVTNNHLDCYNILKKFKHESVLISNPVSYGDKNYIDFIDKNGTNIFKNKISFQRKFLPRESYLLSIKNTDICIMYHNRSQALGNCVSLLSMGVKLFLKPNNPLFQLLRKEGLIIFDATQITKMSFLEFIKPLYSQEKQLNMERCVAAFGKETREFFSKQIFRNDLG